MRILIMGTGGTGGYFGGLLAQAGEDVTFVARGEHLAAIQREGLRVESIHGDFTVSPAQATDDPSSVGVVDMVLFTPKTDAIEEAAELIRPAIGPETLILPVQNGVDVTERLEAMLGPDHALGSVCHIMSYITAPGVIRQISAFRRLTYGRVDGKRTPQVEALHAALERSGAESIISDNINAARWTKFVFITSFGGVGAVTRSPAGVIKTTPEARGMLIDCINEVIALSAASGTPLPEQVAADTLAFFDGLEAKGTTSMQRDIMDGKPSELESLNGFVAMRGKELGVPVPTHTFIYNSLLPQERRARGLA